MRGFFAGRPLASKIRLTAAASRALAPRPYTVSVGKATSPPRRRISAARPIASASGAFASTEKTSVRIGCCILADARSLRLEELISFLGMSLQVGAEGGEEHLQLAEALL